MVVQNSGFFEKMGKQWANMLDPFGITHQDFAFPAVSNVFDPYRLIQGLGQDMLRNIDPFGVTRACTDVQHAWLMHPTQLQNWLARLNSDAWAVQLQSWERFMGIKVTDVVPAVEYDERFQDPAWTDNPYLDVIKEYYLLYTRWLEDAIFEAPDLDEKTNRKAAFWIRQALDAVAPTNYFWTNPIAVRKFIETGGRSLQQGLRNLLTDSHLKTIRMVDNDAFIVGKDLANTPGSVVYRNELFELIQYTPTTAQVHQTPLLFVPPWINKFYVVDLGEKKSMARYLVNQGYTLFMISWKNPTTEMRHITLDDYMQKGVLQAVTVIKEICQVSQVHAIGYCIGGIILTAVMAWLNQNLQENESCPISSWSLFATLVDFSNPGEIQVFIDENIVQHIEGLMKERGYIDGTQMADSFRMLRPNTLIWHYFIHNYLYGEELPKFDVLFWNMDSTRLPEAMHAFYLREFYLNNKFMQPNGLTLAGRPIDVRKIQQPLYAVAAEQDHIAPWKETFKMCGLVNSPVRHVLATSGHILGIISPPVNPPKRRYWVADATGQQNAEQWLATAPKIPGSWWDDWHQWLGQHCGTLQTPPTMGNVNYPTLAAAPGTYVLEK